MNKINFLLQSGIEIYQSLKYNVGSYLYPLIRKLHAKVFILDKI